MLQKSGGSQRGKGPAKQEAGCKWRVCLCEGNMEGSMCAYREFG